MSWLSRRRWRGASTAKNLDIWQRVQRNLSLAQRSHATASARKVDDA
jgi:hypothetical protein